MLDRIGKLGELFTQQPKSEHPLADPKDFRQVLTTLPSDSPYKALEEISGWLESARLADDLPENRLYEITCEFDEAAQRHVFKLTRDYLRAPRLARAEEQKLWKAINGFWLQAAGAYQKCLARCGAKDRIAAGLRESLPLLCTRLIASLGQVVKSEIYRYGPHTPSLWLRLGLAYTAAEQAGVAKKPLQLYPRGNAGTTTAEHEYLRLLVLQTSSLDALRPNQIEFAERLVDHFLPGFAFSSESSKESVYWVDLEKAEPPARLARAPKQMLPSLRFFHPARAHLQAAQLVSDLQQGGIIPGEINLGGDVAVKYVLPVVAHLATCWAPMPPIRKHARHPVKHRMAIVAGLGNAVAAVGGGESPSAESWVVENVSRGGFGTIVAEPRPEWLQIGSLLGLQPEGGENWLLGVVRRYHRDSENEARVGIQTLSRQAVPLEMKPHKSSGYIAANTVRGLWMQDVGDPGEMRVVLPLATFDVRESMEIWLEGRTGSLFPVALVEQCGDYEIARYRRE